MQDKQYQPSLFLDASVPTGLVIIFLKLLTRSRNDGAGLGGA